MKINEKYKIHDSLSAAKAMLRRGIIALNPSKENESRNIYIVN